ADDSDCAEPLADAAAGLRKCRLALSVQFRHQYFGRGRAHMLCLVDVFGRRHRISCPTTFGHQYGNKPHAHWYAEGRAYSSPIGDSLGVVVDYRWWIEADGHWVQHHYTGCRYSHCDI